jgi:hypothetical protein
VVIVIKVLVLIFCCIGIVAVAMAAVLAWTFLGNGWKRFHGQRKPEGKVLPFRVWPPGRSE